MEDNTSITTHTTKMNFRNVLYRQSKPLCLLTSISKRYVSQSPIMSTPRIINAIKQDHREIESYYDRITKSSDKDEQTQYQNKFTWELARHSIGEELVVYPAFEKHLKDGKALADKDREEHQTVSLDPIPAIVQFENSDDNMLR